MVQFEFYFSKKTSNNTGFIILGYNKYTKRLLYELSLSHIYLIVILAWLTILILWKGFETSDNWYTGRITHATKKNDAYIYTLFCWYKNQKIHGNTAIKYCLWKSRCWQKWSYKFGYVCVFYFNAHYMQHVSIFV